MENKNNSLCVHDDVCPSVRPSLFQTLEHVKTQIEYDGFCSVQKTVLTNRSVAHADPCIDEICLIIAEIFLLNPMQEIRINKIMMGVFIVQEVYRRLTHSHVDMVLNNFKNMTSKIYQKKSYLQTALYNSVFEMEAHYTNLVKHDMCGGV